MCRKDSRKSNFHSLPRFSGAGGGEWENQVEFGLESISDIAMCGLCVYMYVAPKTGKTKLSLIIIHILVIKKIHSTCTIEFPFAFVLLRTS